MDEKKWELVAKVPQVTLLFWIIKILATTLGETGLTEVIAIIGYYTLIGNMLNVFQVSVPEGTAPPFPE